MIRATRRTAVQKYDGLMMDDEDDDQSVSLHSRLSLVINFFNYELSPIGTRLRQIRGNKPNLMAGESAA